ncbi:hypothetical protein BGW80DRAFT_1317303 [Lactifluus volemus]|nr:hypothetical protein BGW80DRAFT_1317303 [Lactifluus volemus]
MPPRCVCAAHVSHFSSSHCYQKCSCTDSFQSAFPQCADWCARSPPPYNTLSKTFNCSLLSSYEKMNQMAVLNTSNLPSLVNSIR